jgi:hypothetical protein
MMVKAFWVPAGQTITGVEFQNNDARTVFPEVMLVRGLSTAVGQGTVERRAADVTETSPGVVHVTWSPAVEATDETPYYVCVRFPAGPGKQGAGVGPGIGATRVTTPHGSFVAGGEEGELTAAAFDLDMNLLVSSGEMGKAGAGNSAAHAAPFYLASASPNPFNPTTAIEFGLDQQTNVRLSIYDVSGREVRTLVQAQLPSGSYREVWNGRDDAGRSVAAGVYMVKLLAGERVLQKKLALMK